jgi:hypothetical protein
MTPLGESYANGVPLFLVEIGDFFQYAGVFYSFQLA